MNLENRESSFYRKTFEKYFKIIDLDKSSSWGQDNKTHGKKRCVNIRMVVAKPNLKHLKKTIQQNRIRS